MLRLTRRGSSAIISNGAHPGAYARAAGRAV